MGDSHGFHSQHEGRGVFRVCEASNIEIDSYLPGDDDDQSLREYVESGGQCRRCPSQH